MTKKIKTILSFIIPFAKSTNSTKSLYISILGILFASILFIPVPTLLGLSTDLLNVHNKNNLNRLILYMILLIILYILRYMLMIFSKTRLSKLEKVIVTKVKLDMIDKYLNVPISYVKKEEKGNIMGRFEEANQISQIFSYGFVGLALNFLDFLFSVIMILIINVKVFLFLPLIIPIYYFVIKKHSSKLSEATMGLFISSNKVTGKIFECVNGVEEIKKINAKDYIIKGIEKSNDDVIKSSYKQNKTIHIFTENVQIVYNLINISILMFCAILIFYSNLTFKEYLIISAYIAKVLGFVQSFASLDTLIQPVMVAINRIKEYLSIENEDSSDSILLTKCDQIEFNKVSYKYQDSDKVIINNLCFNLNKDSQLLIKGPIGSGKSTIINLILGLYKPTSGEILVNSMHLDNINKFSLRDKIGIVSQDVFLFNGTILDNISLGNSNITESSVKDIISKLELWEYINQFEYGLDTVISKNGNGVSGGQAKIIGLLRVLCQEKDIIILDEATANLDKRTTEIIVDIFRKNYSDCTLVVITHENSWDHIENVLDMCSLSSNQDMSTETI